MRERQHSHIGNKFESLLKNRDFFFGVYTKGACKMSIPIFTKVKVVQKYTNDVQKDGETKTYYNIKCVDTVAYDSQIVGVSEDVYNICEEGKDIKLYGKCGGLGNKRYWYFNRAEACK